MEFQTVEEVIKALPTRDRSGREYKHNLDGLISSGNTDYLVSALWVFSANGHYTPLVGQRVLEAARISMISAQRLLENFPGFDKPNANFDLYSRLSIDALRSFGSRAGTNFIWSYSAMLQLGVNPKQYFDDVEVAVNAGGKFFGGVFARTLPDVLQAGGDIQPFRANALRVNRVGGLNLAKPFMHTASEMCRDSHLNFDDYSRVAVTAASDLGPSQKATYYLIKNMAGLNNTYGITPEALLSDAKEVFDLGAGKQDDQLKGERAAKWFCKGIGSFVYAAQVLDAKIKFRRLDYSRVSDNPMVILGYRSLEETREKAQKGIDQVVPLRAHLDPPFFKFGYINLLRQASQTAATFFSEMTEPPNRDYSNMDERRLQFREDPLVALTEYDRLPTAILELFKTVDKKTFNVAARFIPRTYYEDPFILSVLKQIIEDFKYRDPEKVVSAIKYTWGYNRRNPGVGELIYPNKHTRYNEEDWWDNIDAPMPEYEPESEPELIPGNLDLRDLPF